MSQLTAFICLSLLSFSPLRVKKRRIPYNRLFGEHLRAGLRKNGGLGHRICDKIRGHVTITDYLYIESMGTVFLKSVNLPRGKE